MWREIERRTRRFPSAVLTTVGPDGYPVSVKVRVRRDPRRQAFLIEVPAGTASYPGPAGLLFHRHAWRLSALWGYLIRGRLERTEGWIFIPERWVPEFAPIANLRNPIRYRRRAAAYLRARGLPRPSIPWNEVKTIKASARRR